MGLELGWKDQAEDNMGLAGRRLGIQETKQRTTCRRDKLRGKMQSRRERDTQTNAQRERERERAEGAWGEEQSVR